MTAYLRKWKHNGKARSGWAVHVVENDPKGATVEVRQAAPKGSRSAEANDYEHKVRNAIREGAWCVPCVDFKPACQCATAPVAKDQTVSEFAEVWQARNRRECAHGTVLFYDHSLKVIRPQFEGLAVKLVKFAHVEAFKEHLHAQEYAVATANNHLRSLRALLEYAAKTGVFGEGARAPRVDLLSQTRGKGKYLTAAQSSALLGWVKANAPAWHAMFVVMLATGLRIGEVIALEWRDVDLKGGVLHVNRCFYRGKFAEAGSAQRAIPLEADAHKALESIIRNLRTRFVFPNGDTHMTEATVRRVFEAASKFLKERAEETATEFSGVEPLRSENLSPHVLRHTFATRKVSEGVALEVIAKLMGHADTATTRIYAKVTDEVLRAAMGQRGNK